MTLAIPGETSFRLRPLPPKGEKREWVEYITNVYRIPADSITGAQVVTGPTRYLIEIPGTVMSIGYDVRRGHRVIAIDTRNVRSGILKFYEIDADGNTDEPDLPVVMARAEAQPV